MNLGLPSAQAEMLVNWAQPVNWLDPENKGLKLWYTPLPGVAHGMYHPNLPTSGTRYHGGAGSGINQINFIKPASRRGRYWFTFNAESNGGFGTGYQVAEASWQWNSDWSVSFWHRCSSTTTDQYYQTIIGIWNGAELGHHALYIYKVNAGGGKYAIQARTGYTGFEFNTTSQFTPGESHHFTYNYRVSTQTISAYVNGKWDVEYTVNFPLFQKNDDFFHIGVGPVCDIDSVRLKYALSDPAYLYEQEINNWPSLLNWLPRRYFFVPADTGEVSAMPLRIQTEGLYVGSHA